MRIFFILLFLVSCSKDVKVPFVNKDLTKTVNVIIENEFVITYTLIKSISQKNDVCKMSLEIKNISKEEKKIHFQSTHSLLPIKNLKLLLLKKNQNLTKLLTLQLILTVLIVEI